MTWIDKDSKTQHSSLPTQFNFFDAISTLKDLKRELSDLGDSDHSAGMELITECWQGLSKRQDTVVVLKSFVDFRKLILECDLSFSRLLDMLDELLVGKRDEVVGKAQIRAFKVLTCQREASTSINQDPRIKYQIKRLNQTLEEFCEMIKDRSKSSELPYRQTQNPQYRSTVVQVSIPESRIQRPRYLPSDQKDESANRRETKESKFDDIAHFVSIPNRRETKESKFDKGGIRLIVERSFEIDLSDAEMNTWIDVLDEVGISLKYQQSCW
ncbi:hypothetical protein PPACK8108_LOCUS23798 [Phakopsora pachyrhizi]|uniref:Uncharacterized protein n=1 Tax=Phakopsora pachyrhizi TaxID=170000 RepID=A0AAV0BNA5_PHAPC|nr:hypothetical protein PPACK8108_LOCUS23798 [Phakopsora pachyrhizi]